MSEHRLVHGSCLRKHDGLSSLLDKSVDHFIFDPPYSAVTHANQRVGSNSKSRDISKSRDLGFAHLSAITRGRVAEQVGRLARRWVLCFTDDVGIHGWRTDLQRHGIVVVRTGVWVKEDAQPQYTGDRPAQGVEFIVIGHAADREMKWNGRGRHGVWSTNIVKGSGSEPRVHETQKPLTLMRQLVADFTNPGEVVCDPFAGSGTTGVACRGLGRRFLGWEAKRKYALEAAERIGLAREQLDMFSVRSTTTEDPRSG